MYVCFDVNLFVSILYLNLGFLFFTSYFTDLNFTLKQKYAGFGISPLNITICASDLRTCPILIVKV